MNDIVKIVSSLKECGLLTIGVGELIRHEPKEHRGWFLSISLSIFCSSLLRNLLTGKLKLKYLEEE